jgi:hypothetical protein
MALWDAAADCTDLTACCMAGPPQGLRAKVTVLFRATFRAYEEARGVPVGPRAAADDEVGGGLAARAPAAVPFRGDHARRVRTNS